MMSTKLLRSQRQNLFGPIFTANVQGEACYKVPRISTPKPIIPGGTPCMDFNRFRATYCSHGWDSRQRAFRHRGDHT